MKSFSTLKNVNSITENSQENQNKMIQNICNNEIRIINNYQNIGENNFQSEKSET